MSYACTRCKSVFSEIPENEDHAIRCTSCGGSEFVPVQVVVQMKSGPWWQDMETVSLLFLVGIIAVAVTTFTIWSNKAQEAYRHDIDYIDVIVLEQADCSETPCTVLVYDVKFGYKRLLDVVDPEAAVKLQPQQQIEALRAHLSYQVLDLND